MSYCLNPNCPNPSDPLNGGRRTCCQCGSELLLQGRYRVTKPLGGGGFGKTYQVEDQGTMKVLKVLLKNHPKAVSLFQQEAQVLISVRHPGIPKIEADGYFTFFPADSDEPLHCLVMELIDGSNLQDWMKSRRHRPITQTQAIDWLRQLSDILDKVHQKNYFHRDIKPHNIMRKPNGQLVLIDFGTAREVSDTYLVKVGQGQNVTGIVSPGYTAPEQTNGKAVPQSDFFSLGRTFVYLLTGKPPTAFPENPRTGKLQWHKYASHISKELADIIDYLMAPFPGNRPQNPTMILQCLAEIDAASNAETETSRTTTLLVNQSRGNTNLQGEKTQTRHQLKTKTKTKTKTTSTKNHKNTKIDRNQLLRRHKLINKLVVGTTFLLLVVATSQFYGFWRYRIFPANPILLLQGVPSSRFLQKILSSYQGEVNAIALTPDGQTLASSSFGTIKIWNLKTGTRINNIENAHTGKVTSLAITPNGEILVSGSADKTIKIWDLKTGKLVQAIPAHEGEVNALAISPDGQTLASVGNDRLMKLWNIKMGSRILTRIQEHRVNTLAFSRDGQLLMSGSDDGAVRLWNLSTGTRRQTLEGHTGAVNTIAISPNNQTLASGSDDGTIRLWNLDTGEQENILKPNSGPVTALIFTPDNQALVSGGKNINIWNIITEDSSEKLIGHSQEITSLAITPDGKTLVSGSLDQTIKVWQMP